MLSIDPAAENQLQDELVADEKLIWAGKPQKGIVFNTSDIFFIPFSILFVLQTLRMLNSVDFNQNPGMIVIVIPFCAFVLHFTAGRFLWDKYKRANTVYGLTKNRIIIKSDVFSRQIESVYIKSLTTIEESERSDNSGSIILMNEDIVTVFGPTFRGQKAPTLLLIDNVKEVYSKILELQKQNADSSK